MRKSPPEVGFLHSGEKVPQEVDLVSISKKIPPEVGSICTVERARKLQYSLSENCCNISEGSIQQTVNGTLRNSTVVGDWVCQEIIKSSTWREVETVKRVLISNEGILRNKKVLSDNKNVTSILQIGSRKPELQRQTLGMHEICNKECIIVSPNWIGRQSNTTADALIRCGDSDSWSMKLWVFRMLNKK